MIFFHMRIDTVTLTPTRYCINMKFSSSISSQPKFRTSNRAITSGPVSVAGTATGAARRVARRARPRRGESQFLVRLSCAYKQKKTRHNEAFLAYSRTRPFMPGCVQGAIE